jgi:uncharacterized membrane protein
MGDRLVTGLIFLSALGSGLIAGAFFAFSSFVMAALARLPAAQGIAAMQSINIVVINPLFVGTMFGTALACIALGVASILGWGEPRSFYLLGGGLFYLIGTVLVTMVFNVPRNDALAGLDPNSNEAVSLWVRYVAEWTTWNHVRTVAALAATAVFILALRLPAAE